jgi:hypothetical protein
MIVYGSGSCNAQGYSTSSNYTVHVPNARVDGDLNWQPYANTLYGMDAIQKEEYGDVEEVLEGAGRPYVLTAALRDIAHKYVLRNVAAMQPWLR